MFGKNVDTVSEVITLGKFPCCHLTGLSNDMFLRFDFFFLFRQNARKRIVSPVTPETYIQYQSPGTSSYTTEHAYSILTISLTCT